MKGLSDWTASIVLRTGGATTAAWLARTLEPEAEREVPRTTVRLIQPEPGAVRIEIAARDTGALRAALNTYLGWVHLSWVTIGRGDPTPDDAALPPH